MSTRPASVRVRAAAAVSGARSGAAALERIRPAYVVGGFVVAEWLATFGLARTVRHNGWLFYQGGDQVWFYTESWLLRHGHLAPPLVGYGWSTLLMPFTAFGGPDQLHVLPAIILLNVLVLMPLAIVAMYGIGELLGGRLFGYWVLLLWFVLPFVGIKYADAGFKQRYTEFALPDSFGLTTLSDFPCMVMLAVAGYLCLRTLRRPAWPDGLAAGLCTGFAVGIKPSSSVFLVGVAGALILTRNRVAIGAFVAGLAPEIVALTVWKWHGYGYVPLLHATVVHRVALGSAMPPLAGLNVHKYLNLDWGQFNHNLASLREHFWSARVVEWTVVAGLVALARLGRAAFLVFGCWFAGYVIVRVANPLGELDTGALLHGLVPSIPAFVVLVAALPVLVPGVARRLPAPRRPRDWGTPRLRSTAIAAGMLLFAVVPTALAGFASRATSGTVTTASGPIPVDDGFSLRARVGSGKVRLAWNWSNSAEAVVFYEVLRTPPGACAEPPDVSQCARIVGTPAISRYVDAPPAGTYDYRILAGANWLNDPSFGDEYLSSPSVRVTVR